MIFIIFGLILTFLGVFIIKGGRKYNNFHKDVKNGNISQFKQTTGRVICNGYAIDNAAELSKPVTPIVEYEVKNKKYEVCNQILDSGAELPVGTIVKVWYSINDPQIAILGSTSSSSVFFDFIGLAIILVGIYFLLLGI